MLRRALVGLIRLYQIVLRPFVGTRCRFHPSCSEYAILAIRENGALRGTAQALWRIARCGPWTAGGVDYPRSRRVSAASTMTSAGARG